MTAQLKRISHMFENSQPSNPVPNQTNFTYPHVKLIVKSWSRDSHGLFDFEQASKKYSPHFFRQEFKNILSNCNIFLNINSLQTIVDYCLENPAPHKHIYIGSIYIHPYTNQFIILSAQTTGISSHPSVFEQNPNLSRDCLLSTDKLQKNTGYDGYPLQAGTQFKLGRVQCRVLETVNSNLVKQTSPIQDLELGHSVFKVPQQILAGICKICLSSKENQNGPLINPCSCKGTFQFIHVFCMKKWMNSKVQKDNNETVIFYEHSKFKCEICSDLLPKEVQLNGKKIETITISKPKVPYIIFESVIEKSTKNEKFLYMVSLRENRSIILGRGRRSHIQICDISISRSHAEIRQEDNRFYIKDLKSKFGTVTKFKEQIELKDKIRLQYRRTCFDFRLKLNEQLEDDEKFQQEQVKRQFSVAQTQVKEEHEFQVKKQFK